MSLRSAAYRTRLPTTTPNHRSSQRPTHSVVLTKVSRLCRIFYFFGISADFYVNPPLDSAITAVSPVVDFQFLHQTGNMIAYRGRLNPSSWLFAYWYYLRLSTVYLNFSLWKRRLDHSRAILPPLLACTRNLESQSSFFSSFRPFHFLTVNEVYVKTTHGKMRQMHWQTTLIFFHQHNNHSRPTHQRRRLEFHLRR